MGNNRVNYKFAQTMQKIYEFKQNLSGTIGKLKNQPVYSQKQHIILSLQQRISDIIRNRDKKQELVGEEEYDTLMFLVMEVRR